MTTYNYRFDVGQKTTRPTWYPNFLGTKDLLGFKFMFYDGMWYDPSKYPQLQGKSNVLWGLMYRGGLLSYDANVVFWGWKPSATRGKFEIYANICTHITDNPTSFKMAEVSTRTPLIFKFFKTNYSSQDPVKIYAFDLCDSENKSIAYKQSDIEGINYWYGFRWLPTMELSAGSPQRIDLRIDEVKIDWQGNVIG